MPTAPDKTTKIGVHTVPAIWRRYLDEDFFYMDFPDEEDATCQRCPQIVKNNFQEPYRCCTYLPSIPNFQLGAALADPAAAPFARGLQPFWLPEGSLLSPADHRLSLAENANQQYGRSEKVKCPALDVATGACGVYAYRNSVCSTYFCWHDQGIRGEMFWEKVASLVGQIETALAQWCMKQLGCDLNRYIATLNRFGGELASCGGDQGGWHPDKIAELFDFWSGTPESFYLACHELIRDSGRDLWALAQEQDLKEAFGFHRAFFEALPDDLKKVAGAAPPAAPVGIIPLQSLWYELKLMHRNLWQLPFGGDPVVLNPRVAVTENPRSSNLEKFYDHKPFRLDFCERDQAHVAQFTLFIDHDEWALLQEFRQPRVIDESFMAAWPQQRRRLAGWLRLLILIDQGDQASHEVAVH